MKRFVLLLLIFAFAGGTAIAQDFSFSGRFRERSELSNRSFRIGQSAYVYHLMQLKLRADVQVQDNILVVMEIQDERLFGESGTTFNVGAPHFDLRQGFVQWNKMGGSLFSAKVGRQVMNYANQRFIGGIDWHPMGQSFDAGVLKMDFDDFFLDAFGASIVQQFATDGEFNRDTYMLGLWGGWKPEDSPVTVQGFLIYDNPRTTEVKQYRNTAGLYAQGNFGGFDFEVDGAYQFGDYKGAGFKTIEASMIGVRAGWTFESLSNFRVGVGYDLLSGQDPNSDDVYGAFHTLYGTNHKYYGHMDYLLTIPKTTRGLGLSDLMLQLSVKPGSIWKIGADVHMFSTASDPTEFSGVPSTASQNIGLEADIYTKVKVAEKLTLIGGYSLFDGDVDRVVLINAADPPGRKTTNWSYLMAIVNF